MQPTKTESGFIKISTDLRKRTDLSSNEKIIIAYLISFQSNDLVCYQTEDEISIELGLPLRTLKRSISNLIEMNICYKDKASIYTGKRQYKNRKAIIVGEKPFNEKEVIIDTLVVPLIETIQPEEKAPQIKEKVSIIEDDEETPLEISALENLKEILDNQYPMKTDIERQLMIIAKNSSSYQINELYKKIKSDKIKSDSIEEFLVNNIN